MDTFSRKFTVKIILFVLKDESKRKRTSGWPIFWKKVEVNSDNESYLGVLFYLDSTQIFVYENGSTKVKPQYYDFLVSGAF